MSIRPLAMVGTSALLAGLTTFVAPTVASAHVRSHASAHHVAVVHTRQAKQRAAKQLATKQLSAKQVTAKRLATGIGSHVLVLAATPGTTTTVTDDSSGQAPYGTDVTFTATVAGSGTPTGTVEFLDGTTPLGTSNLAGDDTATLVASDLAVGAHQITAMYEGDGNFTTSTSTADIFTVVAADPGLSWDGPETIDYGDSLTDALAATVSDDAANHGTISYSTAIGGVTTPITGATPLNAGTYNVTATYTPTDGDYTGSSTQVSLTINQAVQHIDGLSLQNGTVGNTQTLSAIADELGDAAPSAETVTYTASGACSVAGAVLTYTAVGTCTVTASVPGDVNYAPASTTASAQGLAGTTTGASPTLLWSGPAEITWGTGLSGVLRAITSTAAASHGTISYSTILNGVTTPLTGSTILPVGTYTLTATYTPTDATYTGASTQILLQVDQENQMIQGLDPADGVVGQTQTLSATAASVDNAPPSGEAVTYDASGACTVAGNVLTYTDTGTCTVDASVPGDTDYAPATTEVTSNVVAVSDPTLLWEGPASITYGGDLSGVLRAITSVDAAAHGTISYSTVVGGVTTPLSPSTILPVGTYTLTATYTPSDDLYTPATAQITLTVSPENQEIQGLALNDGPVGTVQVLSASAAPVGNSAPSGETVTYQSSGGCSLFGNDLVYTATGTCSVTASVPGDANFAPASTTVTANVT